MEIRLDKAAISDAEGTDVSGNVWNKYVDCAVDEVDQVKEKLFGSLIKHEDH